MAGDYALAFRRAAGAALKQNDGVTDLIPAIGIYTGTVPAPATRASPFTRFGSLIASPFRASGLNSSAMRASIQAFTRDLKDGSGAVTVKAEDRAHLMGSVLKDALDGRVLPLEGGMKATMTWIQTITGIDRDEAGSWMTTVTFGADIAG